MRDVTEQQPASVLPRLLSSDGVVEVRSAGNSSASSDNDDDHVRPPPRTTDPTRPPTRALSRKQMQTLRDEVKGAVKEELQKLISFLKPTNDPASLGVFQHDPPSNPTPDVDSSDPRSLPKRMISFRPLPASTAESAVLAAARLPDLRSVSDSGSTPLTRHRSTFLRADLPPLPSRQSVRAVGLQQRPVIDAILPHGNVSASVTLAVAADPPLPPHALLPAVESQQQPSNCSDSSSKSSSRSPKSRNQRHGPPAAMSTTMVDRGLERSGTPFSDGHNHHGDHVANPLQYPGMLSATAMPRRPTRISVAVFETAPEALGCSTAIDHDEVDGEDDNDAGATGKPKSRRKAVSEPTVAEKKAAAAGRPRHRRGLSHAHPIAIALDLGFLFTSASTLILSFYAVVTGLQAGQPGAMATIGILIASQLYYLFWITTRFFVQRVRGDWDILDTLSDIRAHYMAEWFRFDVVVAVPIDFIFLGWAYEVFFWTQLLRQSLRFVRVQSLRASGNPLIGERKWLTMLVLLITIAVCAHSCAVVYMQLDSRSYINALYFASTTLTSVGYGDLVTSDTASSRIFTIFVEFLGIAMVASVTGFAASLFTSADALQAATDEKKLMLASMLQYYRVPWEVQVEIISLFPTVIDTENELRFKEMTGSLPAFLVEKIEGYTRAKALASSIPLFNSCEMESLLEVAKRLVHRFHQPNEAIIVAGEDGFEMFFLVRGVADVVVTTSDGANLVVATLRSGSFFGEMALVSQDVVRTASVIAVSPAELLVLAKHNFDELAEQNAEVKKVFDTVIAEARNRAAKR